MLRRELDTRERKRTRALPVAVGAGLGLAIATLLFVGVTLHFPLRIELFGRGLRIGGTIQQVLPGERAGWVTGPNDIGGWNGGCIRAPRPPELLGPGSATNYYYYEVSWK